MRPRPRVLVVGAGAAGTLTAMHLLRTATAHVTPLEVVLLDPAVRWARGAAFGTVDPQHLLNVPACGMSALSDQPDDFVAWRRERGLPGGPDTFAPRLEYSRYLADRLYLARREGTTTATMVHRRARALGLRRADHGLTVSSSDGAEITADAVVVATGLPAAGDHWAPDSLRGSSRFVADPWAPGALDAVRRDPGHLRDILVVGTGLTMVDVVLTLTAPDVEQARRVLAISRNGRLPAPHTESPAAPVIPDAADWGSDLAAIRERALTHVEETRRTTGDWRPGVDGVRYRVAELWQRLSDADRATFLARDAGPWGSVRHRMPPVSAAAVAALRNEGRLEIAATETASVEPLGDGGLRVGLADGTSRDVGWVVNCTGPRPDVRTLRDPFLTDLLRPRFGGALGVVATAGMGVRTQDGRLLDGSGTTGAPLWTLGALRRGELWESTAVPEIREQAAALAVDVLAALTVPAGQIAG